MTEGTMRLHHSLIGSACRRLGDSRMVLWFQTQRRRRWLVAGFALTLAAFPLAGWLSDRLWVSMLVLIPYALGSVLLAAASQYLLDRPLRALDERQRQIRQSILTSPYQVGAGFGLAGGLVVARALDAQSEALMFGWLLLVLGLVLGLPSMVLAWKLGDLIDDEVD